MAFLAAALPWIQAAGAVIGVVSAVKSASDAKKAANFQADQNDAAAIQVQAASQRSAMDKQQQARRAMSRAQALAAASGAGATDPTVTDIISDIAGEGEYQSLLELYEGNDAARQLRLRGDMARMEGAQAQRAGYLQAAGTLLQSGSSLYAKYGKGGPGPNYSLYNSGTASTNLDWAPGEVKRGGY